MQSVIFSDSEVIYQRALALELPAHDLEFSREVWIDVSAQLSLRRLWVRLPLVWNRLPNLRKDPGYKVGLLLNLGQEAANQAIGELRGSAPSSA